jgi:putative transferase (TIGR04331 family)
MLKGMNRLIDAEVGHPQWREFESQSRYSCTNVSDEIDGLVSNLVVDLTRALNQLSRVNYSVQFWDRYVRYWLTSFVDTLFVEWLDYAVGGGLSIHAAPIKQIRDGQLRASDSMDDALTLSQDPIWRNQLKRDVETFLAGNNSNVIEYNHERLQAQRSQPLRSVVQRMISIVSFVTRQRPIVLVATYFPRHLRFALSLSFLTLPTRWREPRIKKSEYSTIRRLQLAAQLNGLGKQDFESLVRSLLPAYVPKSVFELFPTLVESCERLQWKTPRLIFSDNQHFSSETFALWTALQGERGAQLAISQHGGLNGQGIFLTRDEQIESRISDAYLHWGWSNSANGVKIPTLIGGHRRKWLPRRVRTEILLVTDATFRYRRKYWSDSNAYKDLVLRTYRCLSEDLKELTTVRLHRDHDRYDESHKGFWYREFPDVQLDDGFTPMRQLLRRARLVICTTLGTTEIECFLRNIPVVLSLDPILHRPRMEFREYVDLFESVGIVHFSEASLSDFVQRHYGSLEAWWRSDDVRSAIAKYLEKFGYQSQRPIREYYRTLKNLSENRT